MEKLLNLLFSGAVSGGIYAVMASGLVLTYQTSGVFNFAHGAIAFVTAYLFYQLNHGQGMPVVWAALLSVVVFAPLLGLALDRVLLRRLATAPVYARIVGTIGLLIALPALALWLVEAVGNELLGWDLPVTTGTGTGGGGVRGIGPFPRANWKLSAIGLDRVQLNSDQVAVFAAAALAALVLWLVLRHTRLGLEMRAVVDREELAALRGVNAARTSSAAWTLTMMLAGVGGILIAPLFQLESSAFTLIVLGSLAAVALAGLRSVPVAFAGGLALGVLQNLVYGYGDSFLPKAVNSLSGLRSAIPFVLTVVLLFVVGRNRTGEARVVSEERPGRDHREGVPAWRRRLPWFLALVALVAFTLQWLPWAWSQADDFEKTGILAPAMALAIVFLSFVVVTGHGGMVSLAQGTFVTAGGFAGGWAVNRDWGDIPVVASHGRLNFALAAVLGAVVGGAVGVVIALPVRRLGVLALALASLALALALDLTVFESQAVGHGQLGWSYPVPHLAVAGIDLDMADPATMVLTLLGVFGLITLLIHNLYRSPSGRAALAVRSSSVAARTSGVDPARAEVQLFAFAAAIAGFGGVMLGMTNGAMTNSTATPIAGLLWLTVIVTFGIRRPGGALLGGLAVMSSTRLLSWISSWGVLPGSVQSLTSSPHFPTILFGLGAINLAKNPDGLFALVGHRRLDRRRARRRRAPVVVPLPVPLPVPVPASTTRAREAPAAIVELPPGTEALRLEGIVAGYGDVEVLHGADLQVPRGQVVALVGANGAGKSTLCAVAAGSVVPTAGRVLLGGADVTALLPHRRARAGLLLVPESRGIFPGLSVQENLELLLRTPEERASVYERFPILGTRRRQLAGVLSGGEQQQLSLAPALTNPPDVLIADEPTLGLSPLVRETIMAAIAELRERGTAILLVEEKAHEALGAADIVAFMRLGRVEWVGRAGEIDEEQLAESYLGAALG